MVVLEKLGKGLWLLLSIHLLVSTVLSACGSCRETGSDASTDDVDAWGDTYADTAGEFDAVEDDPLDVTDEDVAVETDTRIDDVLPGDVDIIEVVEVDPCFDPAPGADGCFGYIEAGFEPDLSGLVPAAPSREPTPCPGCCRQVSFSDLDYVYDESVWGRFVAYISHSPSSKNFQARLVDLDEDEEYIIDETDYTTLVSPGLRSISLYKSIVIYSKMWFTDDTYAELAHELVLVRLDRDEREVIYSGVVPAGGYGPDQIDVFGDHAIWVENRTGITAGQELYLMHLPTRSVSVISVGGRAATNPSIWGDLVVYKDYSSGPHKILLYNIADGTTSVIDDGLQDKWDPQIWEDLVVWVDTRNGGDQATRTNSDIYMRNLMTGETRQVTTNPYTQMDRIDVLGDRVVWTDLRDDPLYPSAWSQADNLNIYGYSISTGQECRMTDGEGIEGHPRLFEDRLLYIMRDDFGFLSLFMVQLD